VKSGGGQFIAVSDYDLRATLECGQAFRWAPQGDAWDAVVAGRWWRVRPVPGGIEIETASEDQGLELLGHHLALDENLPEIIGTFPDDVPMRSAVAACRGLRLLRQEPWECLASFICSSTKQIVQIRQIVRELCTRLGDPVRVPEGVSPWHAFPAPDRIVAAGEASLRACKLGFRAPYLLDAAHRVSDGRLDLAGLGTMDTEAARAALMSIHGVGRKIADCVLLFAYGRQDAFPIDVWVRRALKDLYFPKARQVTASRLERFSATYFGPYAGYAQQYLFHYARAHGGTAVQ
jgi:N-glycosylase/DNA lyase